MSIQKSINSYFDEAMLFICVRGEEIQKVCLSKENTYIGSLRGERSADIIIDSPVIQPVQGRFIRLERGYIYEDISGYDDTWYNNILLGTPEIDGRHRIELNNGDVLRIDASLYGGSHSKAVVLIFQRRYDKRFEMKSLDLLTAGNKLYLCRHEEIIETGDEILDESKTLSSLPPHYAIMEKKGMDWYIKDYSTRFGLTVNNHKLKEEEIALLHPMDVIQVGRTFFCYQENAIYYCHKELKKDSLQIEIRDRTVRHFFKKQVLLKDINLVVYPGEMVLVLGGSGAGKTTFINAVMGYEKAQGTIKQGNIDVYKNYGQMKYEIGFVPQQDLVRLDDTVYKTLEDAADMKMPKGTKAKVKKKRIIEVINMFGLERERDLLVSKLSGGQRKRLSIAIEFIADPGLFFLDEPDSGLDAVMARSLMQNLRFIADQDKMVMVVTHSPDRVADLFDKVIVLARSPKDNVGRLAFFGTLEEAKEFFHVKSMEKIVLLLNRPDEGGDGLADEYIEKYQGIEASR